MSLYADITKLLQQYQPVSFETTQDTQTQDTQTQDTQTQDTQTQDTQTQDTCGQETQAPESKEEEHTYLSQEKLANALRTALYGPPAEPQTDPVEEFLNRPDGPIARLGLIGKETNHNAKRK